MPSDDDEGGDDNTVGDDTDYNIPDDDNAGGEDEGDLGDDMPTDDEEGGDDSGEPPAEGDDTGGGDEDEDLGGDMPSDDDEGGGENADGEGRGSNADSGSGESDSNDDTDAESSDDSSDSNEVKTAEEIDKIEKELFSDLSDQQMAIKHIELKSQFIDLYETLGDVIERVNKIPKTDSNIKALEFVGTKLTELRTMIHYNLTEGYPTRGYTENMVIYQQCLATLNTINQLLEELAPKTSDSNEET